MDIISTIDQFHFLRPAWLLLMIPAAGLLWLIHRRNDSLSGWKRLINPQLLRHLVISEGGDDGRLKPVYMLAAAWLTGILALAGPSWEMKPSPFSEDLAALFIVIKVTPEMLAQDVQPSRLQRGVMKVHDLLALRKDTRTGLVAYAGSAHLVMPLTSDAGIITDFASALTPGIMPRPGNDVVAAVELASQRLQNANLPGSIVLLTDHINQSQLGELEQVYQTHGVDVHILALAAGPDVIPPANSYPAPPLDPAALKAAANVLEGTVTMVTANTDDVTRLASLVERSIRRAPMGEGREWRDMGYPLTFLLALIILFFFRRGGSVVIK